MLLKEFVDYYVDLTCTPFSYYGKGSEDAKTVIK